MVNRLPDNHIRLLAGQHVDVALWRSALIEALEEALEIANTPRSWCPVCQEYHDDISVMRMPSTPEESGAR